MKKIILITFILFSVHLSYAQEAERTDKSHYSVTINPAFYALGGYSVKAYLHQPKRWSFGIAAEAGFELPEFARDQFFENNDDINVDWDFLWGLEARYRLNDKAYDEGLYLLGSFGFEGWTVNNEAGTEDEFDNWYASLGIGYLWYPFKKKNFHLGASYNVVFILNNTEERTVGSSAYNIRSVVPPSLAPNLIIGWRFGN